MFLSSDDSLRLQYSSTHSATVALHEEMERKVKHRTLSNSIQNYKQTRKSRHVLLKAKKKVLFFFYHEGPTGSK